MATVQKTPSILPEWETFKKNLPADLPYEQLLPTAAEAGYEYLLQQTAIEGLADSSVLVSFQVFIGREGKLEPFDTISHRLPAAPGAVSLAARLALNPTLIWLFFGRLPPQAAAAPEQNVDVGQQPVGDIVLPEEAPEEQEYVEDSAPISRRRNEDEGVSIVDHTEPDGVPVFVDPDDLPAHIPAKVIVRKLIDEMNTAALKFSSVEQLLALYSKNETAVNFVKAPYGNDEFGQPILDDDVKAWRTELKDMLTSHQDRIEANSVVREVKIPGGKGSVVPRRRKAA